MSIASRITSIEGHISDIYDSVELTGVDTTDIDKNLVNVPNTLKEGYIDIINNGTDTLYSNFPKVSGEETSLTLNNTYQAPMKNELKGNTSQTGTPSPTNPIPVNVVSGDNVITIIGKNLFDSANPTNVYKDSNANYSLITNGIRITQTTGRYNCCYFEIGDLSRYSGKTITLSLNADVSGGGSKRIAIAKSNTAYTTRTIIRDSTSNNSISLEVPQGDNTYTKLLLGLWVTTDTTQGNVYVDYTNIMLEVGSIASTYEPYQGNTYNIDLPSGMEMCKIGTYQDYIYKDSDKWYLHKEIGKVVLNGSSGSYTTPSTNRFNIDGLLTNYYKEKGVNTYLSNYYQSYNQTLNNGDFNSLVTNVNYGFNMGSSTGNTIRFKDTRYTSTDDFKSFLSANNVLIYYVLATPTNTEITDTALINQLEQFYQAQSKENQTNISQINNDLPFIISASALKKG